MSVALAISLSPRISWSSWQHTQSRASSPPQSATLLLQLLTILILLDPPRQQAHLGQTPTPHHGGSKTQWCPSCCREALRFHSWVSTVSQRSFKVFERISSATSIKNKRHNRKGLTRSNKKDRQTLPFGNKESVRFWFRGVSKMMLKCALP